MSKETGGGEGGYREHVLPESYGNDFRFHPKPYGEDFRRFWTEEGRMYPCIWKRSHWLVCGQDCRAKGEQRNWLEGHLSCPDEMGCLDCTGVWVEEVRTEQRDEFWMTPELSSRHATNLIRKVWVRVESTMPPRLLVLLAGKMEPCFSSGLLCRPPLVYSPCMRWAWCALGVQRGACVLWRGEGVFSGGED